MRFAEQSKCFARLAESLNTISNTLTSWWKGTHLVAGNLTIGSLKAQN
jgi:hypothetical protein